MRSEDVQKFVLHRPFEPFRLTLSNGTTYDIHHPEMAMVTHSTVAVGVPSSSEQDRVYDHVVMTSLSHVMQIELLETLPSQDSA